MQITKITIVRYRDNPDNVLLETSLPNACMASEGVPFVDPLSLRFEAAKGSAEAYCAAHFPGIPVELIDTTKGHWGIMGPT